MELPCKRDENLKLTDIAPVGQVQREFRSNFALAPSRPRLRKRRNTSRPGTSSRSCSASGLSPKPAQPFDIYRTLRVVNPSPFLIYVKAGPELTLVGSSPEIMVRVEGFRITVRPLAGTRFAAG